jgi:uncharacterized protein with von Willebrand factor type A (vWA) domain
MNPTVLPGRLAENVVHFARALRDAGVPVGPDRAIDALRALEVSGVQRRDDVYWTLASVCLSRREQFVLFDQAFAAFWRNRQLLDLAALEAPPADPDAGMQDAVAAARVAEALKLVRSQPTAVPQPLKERRETGDSAREQLRRRDFESMTLDELAQAKALIAGLRLPIPQVRTRRAHPDARGRAIDLRATLRASLRGNSDVIALRRRSPARRHPPLVVLCDISGSMSRYTRMFLHFLHAVTNDRDRVYTFLFGTRLTNVTRQLRHRDVDLALAAISRSVADWSGGTRIGAALREFNVRWSRRVLSQNAVVLLISDGLDRDSGRDLGAQMERLHKSCRKLIWLNPLLRFESFEPLAAGVRAMLPHVDAFLPAHNVDSLADLAKALEPGNVERRTAWI